VTIPQDRTNRGDATDITRPKDRRNVGAMKELIVVRPRHGAAAASGLLVLALVIAACGGTSSPSAVATSAVSASATTEATVAPVATPAVTPAPTVAASPAPALQLLWEKAGDAKPLGHKADTYWPAIDPLTGNIWVAVSFESIYWIFSPDGKYVGSFGEPGTGPGQFNFVRTPVPDAGAGAIAFAPDGSFFVADDGNNRIQKFDPAHKFVKAWGSFGSGDGQFADAIAIATDGKQVYVYDDSRIDIQVFDTDGKLLRKVTNESPWMTVDGAGNFWAADQQGISEFDASGKLVKAFPLPKSLVRGPGLAIDTAGRLYFNQQNDSTGEALGLVRFDPVVNSLAQFSTGGETLAIAPTQDAIYVADIVSASWPSPVLRKYALPAK
jgi:hypothetical protein